MEIELLDLFVTLHVQHFDFFRVRNHVKVVLAIHKNYFDNFVNVNPGLVDYILQVDVINVHCALARAHADQTVSDRNFYRGLARGCCFFLDIDFFYHLEFLWADLLYHKNIISDVTQDRKISHVFYKG